MDNHNSATPDPLEALIAAHPELDPDVLTETWDAMGDPWASEEIRAYSEAERHAHDLVLAYLQHIGTEDWEGPPGELSDRSRNAFIEKAGVGGVVDWEHPDDDPKPVAVIPLDVLKELLADFTLLANLRMLETGGGTAQDLILQVSQRRMAEHTARQAWLAAHG